MTSIELVDALHRVIRELERVGEYSSTVKGVIASLQEVIDRTIEDERNAGRMSDEPRTDRTSEQPGDVLRDAAVRRPFPLPLTAWNARADNR